MRGEAKSIRSLSITCKSAMATKIEALWRGWRGWRLALGVFLDDDKTSKRRAVKSGVGSARGVIKASEWGGHKWGLCLVFIIDRHEQTQCSAEDSGKRRFELTVDQLTGLACRGGAEESGADLCFFLVGKSDDTRRSSAAAQSL
jgi:hypothetical protein